MSILNLLGTGPGVLVYHLLILLTLEAMVGIALVEWQRTHNSDRHRILWVFGGLLVIHALLIISEPLAPSIAAPIFRGIELASLTLLGWAFQLPFLSRRASRRYLFSGLGITILCVITFLPGWYKALAQFPHLLYLTFWQQTFWYAVSMLMALTPVLILLRFSGRERPWLPIFSFAIFSLGFTTLCLGSLFLMIGWLDVSAYTLIGIGRLINMLGYPLFAIAIYHASLRDRQVYRGELRGVREETAHQTQELEFLVETSRVVNESLDLDVTLQRVVENTVMALGADRCAIFMVNPDEPGTINLAAQHVPLQNADQPATQMAFPLAKQPALAHALERRKSLIINFETNDSHLQTLYELLGSQEAGPTIVQPVLHHRRILGALVVGNDLSQRAFESHEGRLCQSITVQSAAAIENAYLYRDLETRYKNLTQSLQSHTG